MDAWMHERMKGGVDERMDRFIIEEYWNVERLII